MKTYRLTFSANPASQVVRPGGRGYITLMTISHAESTAQAVTLYDKDGAALASYTVAPGASPYTSPSPCRAPSGSPTGCCCTAGTCELNLFIVY